MSSRKNSSRPENPADHEQAAGAGHAAGPGTFPVPERSRGPKNSLKRLTARQRAFVDEYLADLNATRAAIRAGYSARSAGSAGSGLLRHPRVAGEVHKALEEQRLRTRLGADFVLEKLRVVAERSLAAVPAVNAKGEETGVWQFNAAAATKALELMGKHLGMFGDKTGGAAQAAPGVELVLNTGSAGPDFGPDSGPGRASGADAGADGADRDDEVPDE